MFRATCSNTSASGFGKDKKSTEKLYATENALGYIGACIIVFETSTRNNSDDSAVLHCWHFGSGRGFTMGSIVWNTAEHHAERTGQSGI